MRTNSCDIAFGLTRNLRVKNDPQHSQVSNAKTKTKTKKKEKETARC